MFWLWSMFANTPPPSRHRNRTRLNLEQLEGRCTPAVFTVDTLADTVDAIVGNGQALDAAGKTSLRAAIEEANSNADLDTIRFKDGLVLDGLR